ncbi:hypothetical protein J0J30_22335 [Vibrio vulnificus]|nr:hypothetical protein [Vibrio vulnificus]
MCGNGALLATLKIRPLLRERIQKLQTQDSILVDILNKAKGGKDTNFSIHYDGTLMIGHRVCVLDVKNLRREILEEAHCASYAMHPRTTKMYLTLKNHYWWPKMKKDITEFVAKCLTCQQVKIEHQAPAGLLHPLPLL